MITMSYFGNQGPSQDGGFIAGMQLGAARLHNARIDRARHSKALGMPVRQLGAAGDVNPLQMDPEQFLEQYGEFLNAGFKNKSLKYPYYVSLEDIDVNRLVRDRLTAQNQYMEEYSVTYNQESKENIETYAKRQAKADLKTMTYIPLFEAAGYPNEPNDNRAEILAQSAVNKGDNFSRNFIATTRTTVDDYIWDPTERDAALEYQVRSAAPQNETQRRLFPLIIVGGVYLLYRKTKMKPTGKASKGALYGVFS